MDIIQGKRVFSFFLFLFPSFCLVASTTFSCKKLHIQGKSRQVGYMYCRAVAVLSSLFHSRLLFAAAALALAKSHKGTRNSIESTELTRTAKSRRCLPEHSRATE
jgi:hypothetical protein